MIVGFRFFFLLACTFSFNVKKLSDIIHIFYDSHSVVKTPSKLNGKKIIIYQWFLYSKKLF